MGKTLGRPRIYEDRKGILLNLPFPLVEFVSRYGHEHRLKVTAAIIQIIDEKRLTTSPLAAPETLPRNSAASTLPNLPESDARHESPLPTLIQPTTPEAEEQLGRLARKFGLTSPAPTTPLNTQSCGDPQPARLQKG